MKKITLSLLLSIAIGVTLGQKNISKLSDFNNAVTADSLSALDKDVEAISYYEKVSENDTLYEYVLTKMWRCQNAIEKYDDALRTCQKLIDQSGTEMLDGYIGLSAVNRRKKMFNEAIDAANTGLKRFPRAEGLYMELGVSLRELGKHAEAYEMFKKACTSDMGSPRAFANLGIAAAENGKNAQALLAFATAIFVNPESSDALGYLLSMEKVATGEYEKKNEGIDFNIGENFDLINEIFDSRRALKKDYKIKLKINLFSSRQLHMIVKNKNLISDMDEDGFFSKRLLPFYEKIVNDNELDKLNMIFMLKSKNEDIAKKVKKSYKDLTAFYAKARGQYNVHVKDQYIEFEGKKQNVFCAYTAGSREGIIKDDKAVGNWYYYNTRGELTEIGKFDNNGEKTGEWRLFSNGGLLSKTINYSNGKLNGLYTTYYTENGQAMSQGNYKDDILQEKLTEYYINGTKQSVISVKDNKADGLRSLYHRNGKLASENTIANGELVGNEELYYANGQKKGSYFYGKEGVEGPEMLYYSSGNLYRKSTRKKGDYEGEVIEYYDMKDKVSAKKNFKNGKVVGEQLTYRLDGSLSSRAKYSENGKESGILENFNLDGSPSYSLEYKKGEIVEIISYYNNGKKSEKFARKNSKINYKLFYPDGTKSLEGGYTDEGRDGQFISYNSYGIVTSKSNYLKGKQIDTEYGYYTTGKLRYQQDYQDGQVDGIVVTFYENGSLKSEQKYVTGNRQGPRYTYYQNGEISEKSFFVNDQLAGNDYTYAQNGKPTIIEKYKEGDLESVIYLDTLGNVLYERKIQDTLMEYKGFSKQVVLKKVQFLNSYLNGKYESYYPNKRPALTGTYLAGYQNGDWIWYSPIGQINKEQTFVMGEQNGYVKTYDFEGKLETEEMNYHGEGNGLFVEYYANGKIKRKFNQIDNERHGDAFYYAPDGELRNIKTYFDGKIIAFKYLGTKGDTITIAVKPGNQTIKTYYKNGKISNEQTRNNGTVEGKYIDYFTSGKTQEISNFIGDSPEGENIAYHENGTISAKYFCKDGMKHGEYKEYTTDGKVVVLLNYVMGELHGNCTWTDKTGKSITLNYYYDEIVK